MAKVLAWKVWYADGSKHIGKTREEWEILPDDGILVIILYYDEFATDGITRYRRVLQGSDFYWLSSGERDHIYGQTSNIQETSEWIEQRYPDALVKAGRWVDDDTFKQIIEEVMADYEEEW